MARNRTTPAAAVRWPPAWPRLETAKFLMTVCSGRSMEHAARAACREPVRRVAVDFGFDESVPKPILGGARQRAAG